MGCSNSLSMPSPEAIGELLLKGFVRVETREATEVPNFEAVTAGLVDSVDGIKTGGSQFDCDPLIPAALPPATIVVVFEEFGTPEEGSVKE